VIQDCNLVLTSVVGVCHTASRVLCVLLNRQTCSLLVTDVLNFNEVCISCPACADCCRKRSQAYHKGIWMCGVTASFTLNPGCGYRRVASFMPWPLYSWLKIPRYPPNRRPSGPQRWSGHFEEERRFLSGIEPRFIGCQSRSLFTLATALLRLVVAIGCAVVDSFYCCTVHFDNVKILSTNKCTLY
jgi:hypothetical protein